MKILVTFIDPATSDLGWRLWDDAGAWVGARQTTGFVARPGAAGTWLLDYGTPPAGATSITVDGTDSDEELIFLDERLPAESESGGSDPLLAPLPGAYAEGTAGHALTAMRAFAAGRRAIRDEAGQRYLDIYDIDDTTVVMSWLAGPVGGPYTGLTR